MNFIFEKLKSTLGSLRNRSLKYIYEDSYEVNSAVWTPLLPEAFQQRYHYSLISFLPVLDGFFIGSGEETVRFRFDFRKLLSDLIIENHYLKGREMSAKEGLGFYAEAGGPGEPIHNVPFEDLKALGSLTVPRGEFWNKHPQLELLQIIKGISSSAHIYNQRYAEAEAFTSVWLWQEGPGELKPLADRAMCEGLNRFVYHTFPHTPPESGRPGWIYNFGTIINTTNGWWSLSKGFHEYIARSCYLLQQGNFRGDVAFYYGDQAPNFVAPKKIPAVLGEGYDYDVVNSDVILHKMTVRNNRIYLPHGQYYEVLVLPDDIRMNPSVLKKIMQLVESGATVIGPKPLRSYSLDESEKNDLTVKTIAGLLWGRCDSIHVKENRFGKGKIIWGKTVRDVLASKEIGPDMAYDNNGNDSLDYIHRTDGSREIYFIRNKLKRPYLGEISFRVRDKQPEFWKAEDGSQHQVNHFRIESGRTTILLPLGSEESCFIVFEKPVNLQKQKRPLLPAEGEIYLYAENGLVHLKKEAVALTEPWNIKYSFQAGLPVTDTVREIKPWNTSTKDSIRYFGGIATYETSFNWSIPADKNAAGFLELNSVKEIARVYLNGELLGYHWHPSNRFNITSRLKPGRNTITIEVAGTINNWLIGEARKPAAFRNSRTNITKLSNAWRIPFAEASLIESGLIGPVTVTMGEYLR